MQNQPEQQCQPFHQGCRGAFILSSFYLHFSSSEKISAGESFVAIGV